MSDSTTPAQTGNFVTRTLSTAIVLDVLFALVAATVNAVFFTEASTLFGEGTVGTVIGVGLSWVLNFFVSLLQGGIFIGVLGGFVLAGSFLLSLPGRFRGKSQAK